MIVTIGAIITLIGFIAAGVSMKFGDGELWDWVFAIGLMLMIIGLVILVIWGLTTMVCRTECLIADSSFQSQRINCYGELVCYCKAPPIPVRPKVVMIP